MSQTISVREFEFVRNRLGAIDAEFPGEGTTDRDRAAAALGITCDRFDEILNNQSEREFRARHIYRSRMKGWHALGVAFGMIAFMFAIFVVLMTSVGVFVPNDKNMQYVPPRLNEDVMQGPPVEGRRRNL